MTKRETVEYLGDGKVYRSRGTCCTEAEGRTRQSEADAADINKIMARAIREQLPPVGREGGVYVDLSDIGSLHESLERVRRAQGAFASLDAQVRNAFENDPAKFVDAFQSVDGVAKLRELKVIPETEETLADRREGAAEARAEKRREARELAKRIEAAKAPPGTAKP